MERLFSISIFVIARAATVPGLPCSAGMHGVAPAKVLCLEKAVCTINDNDSALHKNGNGMGAAALT
jgi:hypothetical protein